MNLGNIKIVDLNGSVIDEKTSVPDKGSYTFKSKRYISYKGESGRPDWWFRWIRHDDRGGCREEREALAQGYSYVQQGPDPYWPEPVPPNGEGRYVYGDVILMKRPLRAEVEARFENARLSRGMAQAKINAFKAELGENAQLPPGLIDEMIG